MEETFLCFEIEAALFLIPLGVRSDSPASAASLTGNGQLAAGILSC